MFIYCALFICCKKVSLSNNDTNKWQFAPQNLLFCLFHHTRDLLPTFLMAFFSRQRTAPILPHAHPLPSPSSSTAPRPRGWPLSDRCSPPFALRNQTIVVRRRWFLRDTTRRQVALRPRVAASSRAICSRLGWGVYQVPEEESAFRFRAPPPRTRHSPPAFPVSQELNKFGSRCARHRIPPKSSFFFFASVLTFPRRSTRTRVFAYSGWEELSSRTADELNYPKKLSRSPRSLFSHLSPVQVRSQLLSIGPEIERVWSCAQVWQPFLCVSEVAGYV
uniref:(northern house mosquito) hypothetical protein n=2 Tax=Culex pipiens TaxID=7175 RepID=A0A8D8CII5_CULPI